jgi:hypothetical protein
MRSGGTAASSWTASLRLLLSAVVALVVSLGPSVSQACAMGAAGAAVCACSCCDLPADDSVGRVPCCVRQADLDAPLPVVDRPDTVPRLLAVAPVSVLLPVPQRVESDVQRSPMVRSTGPPIWLRCHSLLC